MPAGQLLMLRHFYIGDYSGNEFGWTFENRIKLLTDFNSFYGGDYVGMFSFKFPSSTDLDALFSGQYDAAIRSIGAQAAADGRPMFFRPFYEFNQYGDSNSLWTGYAAANPSKTAEEWFIAAWNRFQALIDEGGSNPPNVAFVWCLLAANPTDYQAFYPGDDKVDWVGIDIFSAAHLSNASGPILDWVRSSTADKPILLPEVTPSLGGRGRKPYAGTQDPSKVMSDFVNPFFQFVEGK